MNFSPVIDSSEYNSSGDHTTSFFDVSSASTEIIIPKKESKTKITNVIDCCSYSEENLYLIKNGQIICEHIYTGKIRKISNNRQLNAIFTFSGFVYAKDIKEKLYILSSKNYKSFYWVWEPVSWAPKHILYVSVTLDYKYLCLQTKDQMYLFNNEKPKPDIIKTSKRHIYGKNKDTYLEIDKHHCCTIIIDGVKMKTINKIISGVIDCHDEVHLLYTSEQSIYQDIKILNHKHYYIEKD